MYKVEITEERANGTYRETIIAKSTRHLEMIRTNARLMAVQGSTQTIEVKKI